MITHIFHVSDIHILERNYKNILNSWRTLIAHIVKLRNYRECVLLVITGDVFEYKTYLNSDDIYLFYEMITFLEKNEIRTIIIPGNHDYNVNSQTTQDNISILLMNSSSKYVKCFSKSGVYEVEDIAFYVYSPIDKQIPLRDNTIKPRISIALAHEMISGIDMEGITAKGRLGVDDFWQDIVMLGDIHKPQFLKNNIAYAGSFVQKNRGEDIYHGYILWDLKSKTGKHVWIYLQEVSLKLKASNDNITYPDVGDSKVNHISLVHLNCSSDFINKAIDAIKNKYGRAPDQNIKLNPSIQSQKITVSSASMPKFSHTELLRDHLVANKIDAPLLNRILQYHTQMIQNRKLQTTTTYKIKYLAWSNILCYGPNNYIEFESIRGLASLSGRNKIGKSSIIDILILALFNDFERGHKEDMLNKNSKSGYIKCCFTIGNDTYIIEQVWQKYTATTIKLYKNGENLTRDTMSKTYKFIQEELGLGNCKDFVNLTTALQNRQFIIDLDKKSLYSLICRLLSIDTMRDIEEYVKKERDFMRREKKSKVKELELVGGQDERTNEYVQIKNSLEEWSLEKSRYEFELKSNRGSICDLWRNIVEVDNACDKYVNIEKPEDLPWALDVQIQKLERLKTSREILDKLQIIGVPLDDNLRVLANTPLFREEEFKTRLNVEELKAVPKSEFNLDELYRELIPTSKNKIVHIVPPTISREEALQKINDIQHYKNNITIFRYQLDVVKEIWDALPESLDEEIISKINPIYKKYKTQYKKALKTKSQDELTFSKIVNEWDTYEKITSQNEVVQNNIDVEKKINATRAYQNAVFDLHQHHIREENSKIKKARELVEAHKYCDVSEIELKQSVELLVEETTKWKRLHDAWKSYEAAKINNEKYEILQNNKKFMKSIQELEERNSILDKKCSKLNQDILNAQKKITHLDALNQQFATITKNIDELNNNLELYETYWNSINYKTGIPSIMLKHICSVLSTKCNAILAQITDFLVEFIFEDDIRIYTINKDGTKIPAQLGSGFQKFILDMIMRIVLTKISNISNPNILFIDEGFGCLDKDNFLAVCNCLNKMKDNFDSMIIITHISELQSYMDMVLNIKCENNRSFIQFGNLSENETELFEHAELKRIKQRVDEAKARTTLLNIFEPIIAESEEWTNYIAKISSEKNIDSKDIILKIFEILVNNKACVACNKDFKTTESIYSHIVTKSNFKKHTKFLESQKS